MSIQEPKALANCIRDKKDTLIMTGTMCDEIAFDGKNLLDYTAEIAGKTGAPIAATGNTILGLKARNVAQVKKMWAAELVNYMRHPWEDSVSDNKPELLILIGYNPAVAQRLVSTVKDAETMVLGNTFLEEATYSLPDASSLRQWQQNLEQLVQAL